MRTKKKETQKTKKLMRFRQSLFWDVDPKTIDPKRHARYIIERVLDFGYDNEIRWLVRYYSPRLIKDVVVRSRVLDKKTKPLWTAVYV